MTEWADRVAALEARVARLERDRPDAAAPPGPVDDLGERFWVVAGLRERGRQAVVYGGTVEVPGAGPVEWQMCHDAAGLLGREWADRAGHLTALAHPVRLRLLQLLVTGEAATAADLAATEGLGTTGQVYHHLRQLVAAGWLRATTRGHYEVPAERVVPLLVVLAACE